MSRMKHLVILVGLGFVSASFGSEVVRIKSATEFGSPSFRKTRYLPEFSEDVLIGESLPTAKGRLAAEADDDPSDMQMIELEYGQFDLSQTLVKRDAAADEDEVETDFDESADEADSEEDLTRDSLPAGKPLKRRLLVFKASWCGACQQLNSEWPKLKAVKWRIGELETDHIQLIDIDEHPELAAKYSVASLPTLVVVESGKELRRRGRLNARDIAELYHGRLQ